MVEKCFKCNSEYVKTPICINCGTIPIADWEFQKLKNENERLKLLNARLQDKLNIAVDALRKIHKTL